MTAKEMFKELGYVMDKYLSDEERTMYVYKEITPNITISFVDTGTIKYIDSDTVITISLLKAINQQCKELGWIE